MSRPPNPFCDLWRYVPRGAESHGIERALRFLASAVIHYGWHACLVLRLSQWMHWMYLYPLSFLLQRVLLHMYGVDIPPGVAIGAGLWLPHARNIVVHRKSVIGERVTMFHGVTLGGRGYDGYPVVGDGVVLYVGCSVLGPINVGRNATVGAHALVIDDVDEGATVVGCPARVLRRGDRS